MNALKTLILSALALAAVPVTAQAQSDAEAAQQMINDPNPATFQVYGVTPPPKSIKDDGVQGGRAMAVATPGKGEAWAVGVNVPLKRAIKAGDKLEILFYAKLAKAEPGVTSARIGSAQLQLAAAPYTVLFGKPFDITPEWKLYSLQGVADRDYAQGEVNAGFHLNTGHHTIALGIVAVFDKGK